MTIEEKRDLVASAFRLAQETGLGINEVSRRISEQTGRAVETVRSTLRRFEKRHPGQLIFPAPNSGQGSSGDKRIAELHDEGVETPEIAHRLGKSHDVVHKTVIELRIHRMQKPRIKYVYCEKFEMLVNEAPILSYEPLARTGRACGSVAQRSGTSQNTERLSSASLSLSRENEHGLFRCYNFLKFRASEMIKGVAQMKNGMERVEEAESLMVRAMAIRDYLVRMNLGLVCGLARKRTRNEEQYSELVSEGNIALMRAIELFDYSRGIKFSTYATSALINCFWQVARKDRNHSIFSMNDQEDILTSVEDAFEPWQETEYIAAIRQRLQSAFGMLTDREVAVVQRRFGLIGEGMVETLEQTGRYLGICKERIRQIQNTAIGKLRAALTSSETELLVA